MPLTGRHFGLFLLFPVLLFSTAARAQLFSQQGSKLVGSGAINQPNSNQTSGVNGVDQGTSVALSSNGNTALVGGPNDTTALGPHGCSFGITAFGASKQASWSQTMRTEIRISVNPSRFRAMGTRLWWEVLPITTTRERLGFLRAQATAVGASRETSWWAAAVARLKPGRVARFPYRPMAIQP